MPVSVPVSILDPSATDPNNEAMRYQRAGKRVVKWRRDNAMNQVEFAKRAHVSVGCLQGFEAATRGTRESNVEKIARVLNLTKDQLLAEDADSTEKPNPLLRELLQEDLRLAQRFHHAGAEAKHAVKAFLTAEISEERRERIALLLAELVHLDESLLPVVETILTSLDKDGPATQAVPGKKNG